MRRVIKAIPSFITSINLLCGAAASIFAIQGEIMIAILLILLGAFFDFFDGFFARLLKASSEFGVQMDSLADLISFGFAPTALLYHLIDKTTDIPYFAFISLIIVAFSALRLAKFNIDTEQSTEFRGLPTPASALFIISIAAYCEKNAGTGMYIFLTNEIVLSIIIVALAALMVSRIKLMSLKIKKFKFSSFVFQIILIISAIFLIIFFKYLGIGLIIILYIILSIIRNIVNKNNKNNKNEIRSTN